MKFLSALYLALLLLLVASDVTANVEAAVSDIALTTTTYTVAVVTACQDTISFIG